MHMQDTLSISPVPRHTQPYPWEDLASLLMRVASRMGYPSPHWILSAQTLSHRVNSKNILLSSKPEDYHVLMGLLGLDEKQLFDLTVHRFAPCFQSHSFLPSDQDGGGDRLLLRLGGLGSYITSAQRTKVCPRCLEEDKAYTRLYWHIQPVGICWRHLVFLVDECPVCQKPIPLLRTSLTICPACQKGDYRRSPVVPLDEDGLLLAGQAVVLRHLGVLNEDTTSLQADLGETGLPALPSWAYFKLLTAFRFVLTQLFPDDPFLRIPPQVRLLIGRPSHAMNRLSPFEWVVITTTLWYSFTAWPEGFFDLLEALQRVDWKARSSTGVPHDFGPFYSVWLYGHLQDAPFTFMREAFEEYLRTRYRGGLINKLHVFHDKGPEEIPESLNLSQIQAGRILGVSAGTIDELIEHGWLKASKRPYTTTSDMTLYLIERPSLEKLLHTWANVVPFDTLSTGILGIGRPAVEALMAARMLRPLKGSLGRSERLRFFDRSQVQRFINALRKRATKGLTTLPGAVPLMRAYSFLGAGVTFIQSLVWVFQERLSLVELDGELPWLQRFVIPKEQLAHFRHAFEERRRQEEHLLSMRETAAYLGVSELVLLQWVEEGLLRRDRLSTAGERASFLFRLEDLDRFKYTYLLVEEAATLLQTSQVVVRQLIRIGTLHPQNGKGPRAGLRALLLHAEVVQFHQQETLNLPEAAAYLNRSTRELLHLVKQGHVSAVPGPGKRLKRFQFFRTEIERYQHREIEPHKQGSEGEWLTTGEAARLLGLQASTLKVWARTGRFPASKQMHKGHEKYLFRRSDIEPLVGAFGVGGRLVTTAEAAQLLGCPETDIPELIHQGHLQAELEFARDNVRHWLFRCDAVNQTLAWMHTQAGLLSPTEAAQQAGETWKFFFRRWVKTGHLQAVEGLVAGSGQWFRQADVEQLVAQKADAISGQEAARMLGVSSHTVYEWAKEGKLQAIAGPDIDGFGRYYFSKQAIKQKSCLPLPSRPRGLAGRTRSKTIRDALKEEV